jgi:enamine deaminase RidA (YjgF/YER057c/UK114 family)
MTIYQQLQVLGITLPAVATPAAAYLPFVISESHIYLSGHIAKKDGKVWIGQFGKNMQTQEGVHAARAVAIDLLGTLDAACSSLGKSLNDVKQIVKVMSLVNSSPEFTEHHLVTNGCSELLSAVYKERGAHARSAFGVAQLPMGACVEIEMIARI